MPETNRQIQIDQFGSPQAAVQLVESPRPSPSAGQVLVRTAFAPINPSDVNVLEGRYGKLPPLPAIVGNEGAGTVIEVGPGSGSLTAGDRVIYLDRSDCWQDFVLAEEEQLLRVPADLDLRLASMLKINPLTALCLLRTAGELEPGEWVVQNAANSGVGRAVIAIARASGMRTVNFVRRPELIDPLLEAGADVVALDDDDGRESASQAMGETAPRLALNAVGGESALRLMSMLADGGTHVTYGAMGKKPLKIPNGFLIFRDLRVHGFWLSKWLKTRKQAEITSAYAELAELMGSGALPQPVDTEYQPERIREALGRAIEGSRDGKVLIDFSAPPAPAG